MQLLFITALENVTFFLAARVGQLLIFKEQVDRTAFWVSANPLLAVLSDAITCETA